MGTTILPVGDVLIVQNTPEPQTSFTYKFKTKLGEKLEVTLSDSNETDATKFRDDMIMHYGLEIDQTDDTTYSYWMAPVYGAFLTLIVGIVVAVISFIAHVGGLLDFDQFDAVISFCARWGLIAFWPGMTLFLIIGKFFDDKELAKKR